MQALEDWIGGITVQAALNADIRLGEWLKEQQSERPSWVAALGAVGCWGILAAAIGFLLPYIVVVAAEGLDALGDLAWELPLIGAVLSMLMPPVSVLPAWVALLIAWRWKLIAGVVGLAEGLLLFSLLSRSGLLGLDVAYGATSLSVSLLVSLPSLAVGILLLVSWCKSRTARVSQDTE